MKINLSKRVLALVCVAAVLISAFNTILLLDRTNALQNQLDKLKSDYSADDSTYAYVVFQDGGEYKAKNQASGSVDFASAAASRVLGQAIDEGNSVYIKPGNYTLSADIQVVNKTNARIFGDGATILGNGNKLIVKGDSYASSQNNFISGLTIINGTLRIENSFGTTISDMAFVNCSTALEVANTATWSEGTRIENCRFVNSKEGIVFRTPTGNGTGSYASSEINRCFFNLVDNSVGIRVERLAEFSDSQLQYARFWMGESGYTNQTGILVEGSMFQTLLTGVVFESFTGTPENLYAIALAETAITSPILAGGISFLGNWTARVYNPFSKWISGFGSLFNMQDLNIPIGLNGQYGEAENIHFRPLTIENFKPRIRVQGSFANNETITVRFRLELVDNVVSGNVEKSFTNTTTLWLDDDDMLRLFPSQNVVWAILIDAKANSASTDAVVKVDLYGLTT